MMRYALALLCLAAGSALAVVPPTLYVQVGDNLAIGHPTDHRDEVTHCEITDSNSTQLTLYPRGDDDRPEKFRLDSYDKCKVSIYYMTKADSGEWKVQTTVNKTGQPKAAVQVYNVAVRKMYQEKNPIPASRAWVYPNQQVSVSFKEHFDNLDKCMLLNPEKQAYDLKTGKLADIKLIGQCGFKMNVKDEYSGKWTLVADLKNDTAFQAVFEVHVNNLSDLKPNQTTVIFKRGDSGNLQAGKQQNAVLCIMEDPHGFRYPMQTGSCSRDIPIVTEHHEGIWKAYYGVKGMERLVEQKILVQTYEISQLNHTVNYENGHINLLCRVRSREMKYCTFIRPDGELLQMTPAVGNEKYQYYGNGMQTNEYSIIEPINESDCGLTIRKPSNVDYGSWRCIIIGLNSNKPVGRVLKVSANSRTALLKSGTSAKDVYTKLGDSFTVRCTAEEVLSYCWLRSPDGKVHSVIQSNREVEPPAVEPPALKYTGKGLELGDCTVEIKASNETDAGQWSCHMGVANGPELETNFKVFIKETHLMASHDMVNIQSTKGTTLTCQPLPDSDKIIESCRWVNPLGHGINVAREGRYYTESGTTNCKLTIRGINATEDVGQWSCFARFSDGREGNASVVVIAPSGGVSSFLLVSVIISLLVCAGVGVFAIMRIRPWARRTPPDDKIFLQEKPPKYP